MHGVNFLNILYVGEKVNSNHEILLTIQNVPLI